MTFTPGPALDGSGYRHVSLNKNGYFIATYTDGWGTLNYRLGVVNTTDPTKVVWYESGVISTKNPNPGEFTPPSGVTGGVYWSSLKLNDNNEVVVMFTYNNSYTWLYSTGVINTNNKTVAWKLVKAQFPNRRLSDCVEPNIALGGALMLPSLPGRCVLVIGNKANNAGAVLCGGVLNASDVSIKWFNGNTYTVATDCDNFDVDLSEATNKGRFLICANKANLTATDWMSGDINYTNFATTGNLIFHNNQMTIYTAPTGYKVSFPKLCACDNGNYFFCLFGVRKDSNFNNIRCGVMYDGTKWIVKSKVSTPILRHECDISF
jgi:hypothetical protein